jgi:hypothetical protein
MTSTTSQVNNYFDLLVIETLLSSGGLSKVAQQAPTMMDGVVDKIKSYMSNNIDPNDKAGSVLDMLAPGIISTTLSLFGLGKIGLILGFLARMFHFDLAGILRDIWEGLKSELSGGKSTTSDRVHNIVQTAVQSNSAPAADTNRVANKLRDAQILKIALDNYKTGKLAFGAKPTASMLTSILSFLFRVIISAAGLMLAGDAMNHFLGRPNALDNPIRDGKPVGDFASPASLPVASQTRFPSNPSYQDTVRNSETTNWTESVSNNDSSIQQMLINFAKEVYQGLDGQEAIIQASPYFHNVAETISWYNHQHPGGPIVFIPRFFTTKKQLVDQFIGDVAQKAPPVSAKG